MTTSIPGRLNHVTQRISLIIIAIHIRTLIQGNSHYANVDKHKCLHVKQQVKMPYRFEHAHSERKQSRNNVHA